MTHSEKIKQSKAALSIAQAKLDDKGIITSIVREGPKSYSVIKNFEIVKNYKQRRSCNRLILSLSLLIIISLNRYAINNK